MKKSKIRIILLTLLAIAIIFVIARYGGMQYDDFKVMFRKEKELELADTIEVKRQNVQRDNVKTKKEKLYDKVEPKDLN